MGGATLAAWRERQEACAAVLEARAEDKHTNGLSRTDTSAAISSPKSVRLDFAESQQAGLNALISVADRERTTPPAHANHLSPGPEPSAPERAQDTPSLARFDAESPRRAQEIDRPMVSVATAQVPVSGVLSTEPQAANARLFSWITRVPWPLMAILTVQIIMAFRLIWSNTAFIDEATYLYAGTQELNHWLHGTPVANYQTFLSGSPAIYPPAGAIANAIGGLTGARILSLLFMLGTTSLLYSSAGRLFGKPAASLGTALFAVLGVTQFLSVFATYDPMALFLLALSASLIILCERPDSLRSAALVNVAAPLALGLADATKYATVLWNPVIIGLSICMPVLAGRTWRHGLTSGARFTLTLLTIVATGLMIGKVKYVRGIADTTLSRSKDLIGMGQPVSLVMHDTWLWVGIVLLLAAAGLVITVGRASPSSPGATLGIGALLLLAAVAAPVAQAHIGTTISLHKHLVFGAWFGCMLAGYALCSVLRWRPVMVITCASLLTAGAWYYGSQASRIYHSWQPINNSFIQQLRPLVHPGHLRYLIGDNLYPISYYTADGINSLQWKSPDQYTYVDPQSGRTLLNGPALADAIRRKEFTLIILDFSAGSSKENVENFDVFNDITQYGGYHIIGYLPPSVIDSKGGYTVWRVNGPSGSAA